MAGIKADNQEIQHWLQQTKDCSLQVPIFQRKEVWSYKQVENLLETILNGQPIGCLLLLETEDQSEPHFESHGIANLAVEGKSCKFQLLDGQQRITALWRSLTGDYDRKFFVKIEDKEKEYCVESYPNYSPWIKDPQKTYEDKKLIPIELLLSYKENKSAFRQWVDDAVKNFNVQGEPNKHLRDLEDLISDMSERVRTFEIPFLTLPPNTTREAAIDVFIMTNTSSTSLTKFDIVVGDIQQKFKTDLYAKIELISDQIPNLGKFIDTPNKIGELLLKVACLRTGHQPIESQFRKEEILEDVLNNIETITKGIDWTIKILGHEKIWDSQRLPSEIPFRVIPALYEFAPEDGDPAAQAQKLIRKYLWRCFLSDRYETTAATLLKSDYDGLKGQLKILNADVRSKHKNIMPSVPIFKSSLPILEDIQSATWPRHKNRIARALLAISIKPIGYDLVTNDPISEENIGELQYHHLFPKGYLNKSNSEIENGNLMMNCVLICANSNKKLSSKPPIEYLKARIGGAPDSEIKESDIQSRLKSLLVPYEELCKQSGNIKDDYEKFIVARAKLFENPIQLLTSGDPWP